MKDKIKKDIKKQYFSELWQLFIVSNENIWSNIFVDIHSFSKEQMHRHIYILVYERKPKKQILFYSLDFLANLWYIFIDATVTDLM